MKKKILLILISLTCNLAFAQKSIDLGQDDDYSYKIKQNSFIVYQDNSSKNKFIGISMEKTDIESDKTITTKYKLLYNSCYNQNTSTIELIELNESGTNTINKHVIKPNRGGIHSLVSRTICNHVERIVQGVEFIN